MYNYHRDSNNYDLNNNSSYRVSGVPPIPPNNGRQTIISNNSKPKQEDGYKSYQQKMKALGRVRYINPLARLDYEQKLTELHTKYSSKTKQSVQKKMKAKNQIAEFIDQEQQQFGQQFQQLMDYKYGSSKWKNFHYERESVKKQYSFCSLCDQIHMQSQAQHDAVCKYQQLVRSPLYYLQSLDRIKKSLSRLTSQEAVQLSQLVDRLKKSQNISPQLLQMMPYLKNDEVLGRIAAKMQQIREQIS